MAFLSKKKVCIILSIIITSCVIGIFLYRSSSGKNLKIARDFPQIEKSGTLNITTTYNPVGYYVSGENIKGFNYELLQLLQTYTSLRISIHLEADLSKSIEGLNKEKYDIIVRNFPSTAPMRDTLSLTEPIVKNKLVLIQRKEKYNNGIKPIRKHLDLAGKTLFIPKNSPIKLRIENLSNEIGDTIYCSEDSSYDVEQLAMKVAMKEIDYSVLDQQTAKRLANTLPEIDFQTELDFIHFESWIVRKNAPVLLDSLNTWISKMKETKEYKKICDTYYK